MTHFNQAASKLSKSTRSTDRERLRKSQYWFYPTSKIANHAGLLKQMGRRLLAFLTDAQQVRVWKEDTSAGTLWYAYNPATQRRLSAVNEADLRAWLKAHYRQ